MIRRTSLPKASGLAFAVALGLGVAGPALGQDPSAGAGPGDIPLAEVIDAPYFVIWDGATLRSAPDAASTAVSRLEFGATVFVTGRVDDDWLRAEGPDGTTAYIWQGAVAPRQLLLPGTSVGMPGGAPPAGPGPSDDNTVETANELGLLAGGTVTAEGMVGPSDPVDFYVFTLDGWTEVSITLSGLSSDADLALQLRDGQILGESYRAGTSSELIEASLDAGEYFIEVYMFEGETDYLLSVTTTAAEPPPPDTAGDSYDSARDLGAIGPETLEVDEWVSTASDPYDFFRFEVTERSTVVIELTGMTSDADISIEDDFGSVLGASYRAGADDEYIELVLEPGVYYAIVDAYSGRTHYTLSLTAAPVGPAPEDGAGNTPDEARDLGVIGPDEIVLTDWVGLTTDREDWYRIELEGTSTLSVVLRPTESDADLMVLAEDGATVLGSSARAGTAIDSVTLDLDPGVYFISVTIFERQTDYELTVRATPR